MSFNLAVVDGRLGKDVEVRSTQSGKKVVNFSVGSDVGYGDSKTTLWDTVVCWGQQAEFAEKYLKKGSGVLIVGERRTRSWDQNGEKKYITEIHANQLNFSGSKPEGGSPENGRAQTAIARAAAPPQTRTQQTATPRIQPDDPFGDGTGITDADLPF